MTRSVSGSRPAFRYGWLIALPVVVGCDSDSGSLDATSALSPTTGASAFDVSLPAFVARAIDPDGLVLRVRVGQNSNIPVETQANGQRVARTTLPRGRYTRVGIEWSYEDLVVARAERDVAVPSDAGSVLVAFSDDEYDTTADVDGDDRSNLAEFSIGTDPRSRSDPGGTLDDVALTVQFALPAELFELDTGLVAALSLDVNVNQRAFIPDPTGISNRRRVSTTVPRDSDVFVTAEWRDGTRRLARVSRRLEAGNGRSDVIASRDYDTGFDDDFDGVSNAEELVAEVQSTDDGAGEEAAVACAISVFDTGCDIDTDGDGKPDSVERETADSDGDAIPDYLESSLEDADEDGFNAEEDVNESDPCAPDNRTDPCIALSQDTDGDGKLDADEGSLDTDGDGRPDVEESAIGDRDEDGTVDELDEDDRDPCIPNPIDERCL